MDPGFRARVRAGDERAFATLFHEHGRPVYNHCFRLTGDWSVPEDCTSLVYLEAWRLRHKVDPEGGSLLPWLYGTAVHVVHRRRRGARRHRELMARMPVPRALPDIADDIAGRVDDRRRIAAVRTALERLSRADREVLALCVWGGLDYAAAAEALGVPVGTADARRASARRLRGAGEGARHPEDERRDGPWGARASASRGRAIRGWVTAHSSSTPGPTPVTGRTRSVRTPMAAARTTVRPRSGRSPSWTRPSSARPTAASSTSSRNRRGLGSRMPSPAGFFGPRRVERGSGDG
ncbi:hypothetical protein GCM10011583_26530 [Streptomyces camponoticapitis]|uniref:Sigma-70 family RNA polymerase sigma factor n=1 Tax=Streptomyces camponoticapitis TaxID=1616125 RepID=A0ABQ2E3V1_9ACTN|nr:sigma-70 family RNA polymerase sigma factor [Streptomyces camponoticapitis]GGJ93770.1 hypothetical protein GCM10011583_26530 [Streptomyces camponoticapitis]